MNKRRRSSIWVATGHTLTAVVLAGAMALTTSAAATLLSPTTPALPVPRDHLKGLPEAASGVVTEKKVYGPSLLSCHSWPNGAVTQSFDPHSPACVSTWDHRKGNGGSTAKGVEGNLIRIGVPNVTPALTALAAYFNATYQFYGRSIQLVPLGQNSTATTLTAMIANASTSNVFAAVDIDMRNGTWVIEPDRFIRGLAQVGVIGVVSSNPPRLQATLDENAPYGWSVLPAADVESQTTATAICQTLKGGVARYSPDYQDTPRKFAVVTIDPMLSSMTVSDTTKVPDALRTCGVEADLFTLSEDAVNSQTPDKLTAFVSRLKQGGYTTVVLGDQATSITPLLLLKVSADNYRPEWFFGGLSWSQTALSNGLLQNREAVLGTFSGDPDSRPASTGVAYRAFASTKTADMTEVEKTQTYDAAYQQLALLAAGIQSAGPELTPDTFAAGLESAKFPDPQSGAPDFRAATGFQLGDHTMLHGTQLVAFRHDAPVQGMVDSNTGGVLHGLLCPMQGAQRFDAENPFPGSDAVFSPGKDGPC